MWELSVPDEQATELYTAQTMRVHQSLWEIRHDQWGYMLRIHDQAPETWLTFGALERKDILRIAFWFFCRAFRPK